MITWLHDFILLVQRAYQELKKDKHFIFQVIYVPKFYMFFNVFSGSHYYKIG